MQYTIQFMQLYDEINIICVAILIIVLYRSRRDLIEGRNARLFRISSLYSVAFFVADTVWLHLYQIAAPGSSHIQMVVKSAYFLLSTLMCYWWFLLFESMRGSLLWERKPLLYATVIPIVLHAVSLFRNAWTHYFFYYDADLVYHRGPLFLLQYLFAYAYVLYSCLSAFIAAFRPKNYARREYLLTIAFFPVVPAVCGIIQLYYWRLPVACAGITIAALILYLNLLRGLISRDELTGLSNRRALLKELDSALEEHGQDGKLCLVMIDVDHFKKINDQYGHTEGDRALKVTADALKNVCKTYHCAADPCRYGGDEFVVCLEPKNSFNGSENETEAFREAVSDEITTLCHVRGLKEKIGLSVGFASNADAHDIQSWIVAADKAMYEVKKAHHSNRQS